MRGIKEDLSGQQFGSWTVLREATPEDDGYKGKTCWLCRCECGVERVVVSGALRNGMSRSCGAMIHRPDLSYYLRYYRSREKAEPKVVKPCRFQPDGVVCSLESCVGCGWNPAIEQVRKELLRKV